MEHPFGTIKWYDGVHYFLCRGKEKVSAEIALSFLTYNLRRAMNIMGAGVLVARIRERNQKTRPERPSEHQQTFVYCEGLFFVGEPKGESKGDVEYIEKRKGSESHAAGKGNKQAERI